MCKKLTTYDFIEKAINIHGERYDFWLPDENLLIEYDGEPHFKSVEYLNGNEGLRYRQICDKIKTDYAHKNGIELLRIPYTKIKKIPHILEEKIMTLIT